MASKERQEKNKLLDMTEEISRILLEAKVEGRFDVYYGEKPYLIEVTFLATLPQVTEILQKCEKRYGMRVELEATSSGPMPAPCTIAYEYIMDVTYE